MCGLLNSFKSKMNDIGSSIKRGAKQAAKFAWNNRETIGKAIGAGLNVASTLGVPGANVASKIVHNISNVGKQLGEEKFSKGLDSILKNKKAKEIAQKESSQSNNNSQSSGYSLVTKGAGGTREGRMFNSYRSFR